MTFCDRVATAFLSLAYLAATSLNAGPISFLSTAWQAMQFFFCARSALAKAGPASRAAVAMTSSDFMVTFRGWQGRGLQGHDPTPRWGARRAWITVSTTDSRDGG